MIRTSQLYVSQRLQDLGKHFAFYEKTAYCIKGYNKNTKFGIIGHQKTLNKALWDIKKH